MGREQTGCFVVPPKFKRHCLSFEISWYGERAVGVSAPAPPLSFARFRPKALSAMRFSLCGGRWVLLRLLRGELPGKWDYAMGLLVGLTMQRQSRSPRARPNTSISAVAMLLAKGILF